MNRVRLLEDWRCYWNYQVISLAKGEEVAGEFAAYLADTGSPVEILDDPSPETDPGTGGDCDPVPKGSAEVILAWVGDDAVRAARAIDAELASARPRTTLVPKLEEIATTMPPADVVLDGDDSPDPADEDTQGQDVDAEGEVDGGADA
jgi:hypothetical protein